jgi:hypothetical protein
MTPAFIPGLELSRRFYGEAVGPLLDAYFDALPHSAARVGSGSEVLGFDTGRSADHEWGPRLQIFLRPEDARVRAGEIVEMLANRLPKTFLGYSTNFVPADNDHVRRMARTNGPVSHRVEVTDLRTWLIQRLGFDPRAEMTTFDWLATPTQLLAEVTAGAVFHDGLAELVPLRARLAWYPTDVWRYVLASQWQRIAQEEAFVGRCGEVGDDLGSAIVAARLVRDTMRLCLLMHRRYPPYSKWLGSAFGRLPGVAHLSRSLANAASSTTWHEREHHLVRAYEAVAEQHNDLGLTDPLDPVASPYHDRPFQVLHAGRFVAALTAGIEDPAVRSLPPIGAVDQFVDNTDLLGDRDRVRATARAALAMR